MAPAATPPAPTKSGREDVPEEVNRCEAGRSFFSGHVRLRSEGNGGKVFFTTGQNRVTGLRPF